MTDEDGLEPLVFADAAWTLDPVPTLDLAPAAGYVLDLTADAQVSLSMTVEIEPARYAQWLRWLFGPGLPRAKSVAEQRWEDDGGPLAVECEGYEHVIVGAA